MCSLTMEFFFLVKSECEAKIKFAEIAQCFVQLGIFIEIRVDEFICIYFQRCRAILIYSKYFSRLSISQERDTPNMSTLQTLHQNSIITFFVFSFFLTVFIFVFDE